ncbi:MAG: hypothetical protein FWH02_07445 [Oscillospiraceae bacterium]|nr:hypothetical protein [Oscillospiraceae bacterium]
MDRTIAFVTNQFASDRIILAAKELADQTRTGLDVVEILDLEYELDPAAVEYLHTLSRKNKAIMKIMFTEDKIGSMREIISHKDSKCILTGLPATNDSVLYTLWKDYPNKMFYTVDHDGRISAVAKSVQGAARRN